MTLNADRRSGGWPALGADRFVAPSVTPGSLQAAAGLRTLGRLAGGLAHDVNNLLTVILACLRLSSEHGLDPVAARRYLDDAERAARRASELSRGMLGFLRHDPPAARPVDLHSVLQETVALLRRLLDPRIELTLALAPEPCVVEADPAQLGEVLMNLALNARDAMPLGGRITFSTRLEAGGDARTVRLSVRDTGVGLDPAARAHLFEDGFTTKSVGRGTGLGLATVARIVRGLAGSIECVSFPGHGTEFTVSIPGCAGCADATVAPVSVGRGGGERVLVVDDEPMIREVVCAWLTRVGYAVTLAEDGEEALERCAMQRFDLVLLDLSMPRRSGKATLAELNVRWPRLPVVLMSGAGHEQLEDDAAAGRASCLAKPFELQTLSDTVRRALDAARGVSAA